MRNFMLFAAVSLLCLSFEFGIEPEAQSFKKMTIEYREFQGSNKKAYKLEEITKNEKGWITAHNLYDESGNLVDGSYSLIYDNNGNIKEKKYSSYQASAGKVVHRKITYENAFDKGKLKHSVLIDKENPGEVDSITYVRDASGNVVLKRTKTGDITKTTMLNKDGKPEKEMESVEGKLAVTRTFTYDANGLIKISGINPAGEEIQLYTKEYDKNGRMVKQDRTYKGRDVDFHSTYKYNASGQMTTEERTDNGTKRVIVYEYLPTGMLDKISIKNEKAIRLNERVYTYE